jgi:hypothetical protein
MGDCVPLYVDNRRLTFVFGLSTSLLVFPGVFLDDDDSSLLFSPILARPPFRGTKEVRGLPVVNVFIEALSLDALMPPPQ